MHFIIKYTMAYNGQALQDKYVLNVLNNKKTDISLR